MYIREEIINGQLVKVKVYKPNQPRKFSQLPAYAQLHLMQHRALTMAKRNGCAVSARDERIIKEENKQRVRREKKRQNKARRQA